MLLKMNIFLMILIPIKTEKTTCLSSFTVCAQKKKKKKKIEHYKWWNYMLMSQRISFTKRSYEGTILTMNPMTAEKIPNQFALLTVETKPSADEKSKRTTKFYIHHQSQWCSLPSRCHLTWNSLIWSLFWRLLFAQPIIINAFYGH